MPTTYKPETYEAVSKWMEETKIQYAPNPKSGKSQIRYEQYAKARNVGQALKFGSKNEDLLFDYEHGHLQVIGPVREAAIDPSFITDFSSLTKTDIVVSKWAGYGFREADAPRKLFRQAPDGTLKVVEIDYTAFKRGEANVAARSVLEEVKQANRKLQEADVLSILRMWSFKKNDVRQNVIPDGQDFVYSDTLGMVRDRTGHWKVKGATRDFPDFTRLLSRWLADHRPAELEEDFPFTSINVNFKYAARRHRDGNNMGPSIIKGLGNYTGGELVYFPNDDRSRHLDELPQTDGIAVSIKDNFVLFNGNCAHEVNAFEGERYSLVFFSCRNFFRAPEEVQTFLKDCGIPLPTLTSLEHMENILHPPAGYSEGLQKLSDGRPPMKVWPLDPAELIKADSTSNETSGKKKRKAKDMTASAPPMQLQLAGSRKKVEAKQTKQPQKCVNDENMASALKNRPTPVRSSEGAFKA